MKKISVIAIMLTLFVSVVSAVQYSVKSPDGKLEAKIVVSDKTMLSIFDNSKALIENIEIAMDTDKGAIGKNAKVVQVRNSSNDKNIKTVFGIASSIRDCYNQLELDCSSFKIQLRAYDEAVAYRFVSNFGDGKMKVFSETLNLPVSAKDTIITQFARGDITSYEELFTRAKIGDVQKRHSIIMPMLLKKESSTIAVVESNVQNYPMLRFRKGKAQSLETYVIKYPKTFKKPAKFGKHIKLDYDTFEDYIANTQATRQFPWRAFIVAGNDADLSVNTTVYKLAEPSRLKDVSWIETGLCVWEWWNFWSLEGVDFETGVNEATYRKYIDFAAEYKIPYVLFDAGWLIGFDVDKMGPNIHERMIDGKPFLDVKSLIDYAHSKGVKVLLWCLGESLSKYCSESVSLMKSWGADGMKVDFFDRDDQTAMELYYRIAAMAAKYKMVVDFHGCAKPAGLERTYPNVINFEAVRGLEMNKFSPAANAITPSHNVDLVMTRMLQGPMDYTPGAMRNVAQWRYSPNTMAPVSMGTRAHQVALYGLFYAPLQMLCDSPSEYAKYPQTISLLATMPTTWDESKPIEAKIGEYVVLARRKGDVWYVSGICNNKGKKVSIDLSKIVPKGSYKAEIFRDTVNSNRTPQDYKLEIKTLSSADKLNLEMKQGGGFMVRLSPEKFPILSDIVKSVFGE